jgi:endonuclease/exonuclease/phosphatase family metal-dependent hydrolase
LFVVKGSEEVHRVLLLLCVALAAAISLASVAGAETVRFATFNVYWLFDDEPPRQRWAGRRPGHTWEQTLAKVADAIAAIDADVIALQEVEDRRAVQRLNEALAERNKPYPHFWVGAGTDPFTGQDVAVMSRFPNITEPILAYTTLREDFKDEKGRDRVAALQKFMRVDLEVFGEPVTVYALHLKSKRGNQIASDGERLAQAKMIRRLVRATMEKGKPKVVVMGDFNDDPDSEALREIRGLNDTSWNMSHASESIKMQGDNWTYVYDDERQAIDHILLNKFLFDEVLSATVHRFDDSVSDHDAFAVDVQIGTEDGQ